jgi:hypothetical protein
MINNDVQNFKVLTASLPDEDHSWSLPEAPVTSGTGVTLMPECDAGLTQLDTGKNADAGIISPAIRHLPTCNFSTL